MTLANHSPCTFRTVVLEPTLGRPPTCQPTRGRGITTLIHLTHAQPDGTPARAECDCGAIWQAELGITSPTTDFQDFFRHHMRRGRYLGAVSTPIAQICTMQPYHPGGVASLGATSPVAGDSRNPTLPQSA